MTNSDNYIEREKHMRAWLVVLAIVVGGCAERPIDIGSVAPPSSVASSLCIWHFTQPDDTSDSAQTAGVSSCDLKTFTLDDGIVEVSIAADGSVSSSMCPTMTSSPVGRNDAAWFVDVAGCGIAGMIGYSLQ